MLNHSKGLFPEGRTRRHRARCRMLWGLACAWVAVVTPMSGVAQNAKAAGDAQSGDKATLSASSSKAPGASPQVEQRDQKTGQQDLNTPGSDRRKQIADESNQLLALAIDLKAEVDKTNRDTLSISVIRKADEIEKLAHNVRDKLKQTAGGSGGS